jgi:probable rRNA maturation factor
MAVRYLPPWRIEVTTRPGVDAPTPLAALCRLVASALEACSAPSPASVGLILSDDRELAALNRRTMGHTGPTDVLSFPLLPPDAFPGHTARPDRQSVATGTQVPSFALPPGVRPHLGDVVVSVERASEQASEGRGGQTGDVRWDIRDELSLLVVHGVLHVCGWDHAEPDEEAAMRRLERTILETRRSPTGSGQRARARRGRPDSRGASGGRAGPESPDRR